MSIKNTPGNRNSCIYKIPCSTYNSYYVGQTGASLETRVSQHKGYVRLGDENKAIFLRIKNTNHSVSFQQASVMKYTNIYINRNLIESAVIKVISDVLLN